MASAALSTVVRPYDSLRAREALRNDPLSVHYLTNDEAERVVHALCTGRRWTAAEAARIVERVQLCATGG